MYKILLSYINTWGEEKKKIYLLFIDFIMKGLMRELEKILVAALNVEKDENKDKKRSIIDFSDGCDLAAVFIAKDGTVTISAGNTHVFVCDRKDVQQIKGQRLSIGDGKSNREFIL